MSWIAIAAGALVGLLLLAAALGWMLPRRHVASVRARFAAPPEDLWAAIRDFAAWPSWNPCVKRMERLPDRDGMERWRLSDSTGGFPSVVEASEPPAPGRPGRLVTRIDDPGLPFGGTWTWDVAAEGAGASVTITEDGEVRNPIFRLLAKYVFGHHATAERTLAALGRKQGEAVVTERVERQGVR